jgi:hypothetical protein
MQGHMTRRLSLAAVASIALALGACGDEEPIPPLTTPEPEAGSEAPATTAPDDGPSAGEGPVPKPPEDKPSGPAESGAGDPRVTELEREADRTVRAYVAALNARDGERACELIAPGALDELELPRPRPDCAAALEASIGYRDPRGLPVWEGAELARVASLELEGDTAKVVATVVTRFADRDEPSVEDDIVYLIRDNGDWVIAKPSATLYRAIGAEAPPALLAPPG